MHATEQKSFSFSTSAPAAAVPTGVIKLSAGPIDHLPESNGRKIPANVIAACADDWFNKLRAGEPLYIDVCHRQVCNACGFRSSLNTARNLLKRFGILEQAVYAPRKAKERKKIVHNAVNTPFGQRTRQGHNTPIAIRGDLDALKKDLNNVKDAVTGLTGILSHFEKEINELVEKKVYAILEAADPLNK